MLAVSKENNQLFVAGTHHAEYQSWLASPDCPKSFLNQALAALSEANLRPKTLQFKFLPKDFPIQHFCDSQTSSKIFKLTSHSRPLMIINTEEIEASFRKKSNKSRFNRLKKHGEIEFKRISDLDSFDKIFDKIIEYYDLRQGAVNNSFPFLHDPKKKDFHLELIKRHPKLFHITAMTLDNDLVSAHIGVEGKKVVHLAIIVFSPFYAAHSPGKLHLMQLGRQFCTENIQTFDLTPGGDAWKERFANCHDEVWGLVIYKNRWERMIHNAKNEGITAAKNILKVFHITPDKLRNIFAMLKRINAKSILRKLHFFIPTTLEMRIYRHTLDSSQRYISKGNMQKDDISALLKFTPLESWQSKQSFSLSALAKLENGERCYTFSSDEELLHYGWLIEKQQESFVTEVQQKYTYPPKSVVLYDFYTHPNARGKGFYQENIKQMLSDLSASMDIDYIYISVKANNAPSRHVIEKLGFEYQESLFNYKFLGFDKKWAKRDST